MSWNYRVVRHLYTSPVDGKKSEYCKIHEVYYMPDGSVEFWSTEGMSPFGESPTELKEDLGYMLAAFNKPVLFVEDLPGYESGN